MIQDTTAHSLSKSSGLEVDFNRGHGEKRRGYWIIGGAFLGADASTARKTLDSILALRALAEAA